MGKFSAYKETTYKTYEEFFEKAIYKNQLFEDSSSEDWIYRGECSDKFKLVPSVLRPAATKYLFHTVIKNKSNLDKHDGLLAGSEYLQIMGEYQLLSEFYKKANKQGLWLPEGFSLQQAPFDSAKNKWFYDNNTWYSDEMSQLATLAQHYGLPTRMLDWSQDLLTALYFACHGACRKLLCGEVNSSDYMVIWLLNEKILNMYEASGKPYPIKFVVPKYYDNPNLKAQQGILTYWNLQFDNTDINNLDVPIDRTPLDQKLLSYKEWNIPVTMIHKVKIPINECVKALMHIDKLSYNSARFFPGYTGIKQQIDDDIMIRTIIENHSGVEQSMSQGCCVKTYF